MREGFAEWVRSYRTVLWIAPVALLMIALGGMIHARVAGLPVLETILTWAEWFAAILFLPIIATIGTQLRGPSRGVGQPTRPALVSMGYVLALLVFGADLLVRAVLGLGWEPFLLS